MKKQPIVFDTYAHNYGLLIPSKTGIFWEQQTDGVACHHVRIEGTFLPLDKPHVIIDKNAKIENSDVVLPWSIYGGGWNPEIRKISDGKKWIDLTRALQSLNYQYKHDEVKKVFAEMLKKLPFDVKTVKKPQKVRAAVYSKKRQVKKKYDIYIEKYEVMNALCYNVEGLQWIKIGKPNKNASNYDGWILPLIGKTVALVYPNCD